MTDLFIVPNSRQFFRSPEATSWSVRDGAEKKRLVSRSNMIPTVKRRPRLQNTGCFSALKVLVDAYGEKGIDTMGIGRGREAAPFNKLLSRMIFLA